ncbi:MAG: type II secretion system protein N [Syntrophales bacterium]
MKFKVMHIDRMRLAGVRPQWIFILLIAATFIYSSADILQKFKALGASTSRADGTESPAAAAAPAGRESLDSYQIISRRNLFGSTDKESDGPGMAAYGNLEQTTLQLELLGTIAGEGSYRCAVINDKEKNKPRIFKIGDSVANATLVDIMRNSVVLRVGDRDEILNIRPPRAEAGPAKGENRGAPQDAGKPKGAGTIPDAYRNIREVLTQANARPHFESGKLDGFVIGKIKEGSILRKAGLEDGDIIVGINGKTIEKPDDIFNLDKLGAANMKTSLKVKRQGRELTLILD